MSKKKAVAAEFTGLLSVSPAAATRRANNSTTSKINIDFGIQPVLIRHDSEFTVNTAYCVGTDNVPRLNVWQGAALLTAECLGTGLLALPADVQVLGLGLGLGFLLANLPINLYAGTIFHMTAAAIEQRQAAENRLYKENLVDATITPGNYETPAELLHQPPGDANDDVDFHEVKQDTFGSVRSALSQDDDMLMTDEDDIDDEDDYCTMNQGALNSAFSLQLAGGGTTTHTMLHHDTATFDFIGMTQALFRNRIATRLVMLVYYTNIFLVLGNYVLVMSHSVAAVIGEDKICLPTAGIVASMGMFLVTQLRSMASLGRAASIASLTALVIVVLQCLWSLQFAGHDEAPPQQDVLSTSSGHSILRKLSALGSIGFAVGSQKLFLNIRHELADRSKAPYTLAISLTAFGTLYALIVLIAGPNPPGFLFDAIPLGWSRRIAGLLLWGHVVVSYAINSQAICSSMDRIVFHRLKRIPGTDSPAIRWLMLTALMAVSAYTVANAIPFFTDLVALIGAMTSVPLTLLFPALFYRKHMCVPLWSPTNDSMWSTALTYFSVVFMVTATAGSLYSIQQDWDEHGEPFSCH